ncbi:hypothetical protein FTM89_03200 [Chlamydia trachomatis]|uniref:Lipoprotein n=1 Tax=Chlamydia muridarum (strain MoPn / Nigg) TaxID=243161 RepID=Q9PK69_CHLMU|nr:hypothetical protein [Chlamydia muridarum]AAF39433.1 hypothetical protein TC_0601 [Chlamydia muridarum str. Nigg]UFT43077.1 hypothetical protein FTN46_03200 [Chlamydia trachomatis]KDU80691.1 hypothetical protein DU17_0660 [Chlamydia muridarum]KDU82876.1 hypothetical protein DU19_0658 [Chlamydia muridarum]KDU83566.1 hypothetical protein DU20_0659 [Chlamydia muridarum]
MNSLGFRNIFAFIQWPSLWLVGCVCSQIISSNVAIFLQSMHTISMRSVVIIYGKKVIDGG